MNNLFENFRDDLKNKAIFEYAKNSALDYVDNLSEMDVFPCEKSLEELNHFEENMPDNPSSAYEILKMLHQYGSKNTVAQTGGKYFGFVCGSSVPAAMASKWLTDVWDQNSAAYVLSPIASTLETLCEKWIVDLLGLPTNTAAGFVTGSATAIICALATARNTLLNKSGWDVKVKGLFNAPRVRVVLSEQAHSTVYRALALLGFGKENLEIVPADSQGRICADKVPPLDSNTIFILQAGNVNTGAFDDFNTLCEKANKADSWVHIDGAFGIWAGASKKYKYLVNGYEKANSWSADAHKTLNAPYDCGFVLCRDRNALASTMQMTGAYIQFSEQRDGMIYTPEMSRRARSVELWATLKSLGRSGVDTLVTSLCENAKYFAKELSNAGFIILNDVVFNQVLFCCDNPQETQNTLKNIQASGKCWCGGTVWENAPAIRISVCSWQTTKTDIDECVEVFVKARKQQY